MIRHRLPGALALAITLSLAGSANAAELQKSGPEVFPGKFAVGVHPFGVQAAFEGRSTGGYKFTADFAASVKQTEKLNLWIGGGLGYAHPSYSCGPGGGGCAHDIELWVFVRITLEKLLKIPLVPYVQAGIGGDILVYGGSNLGGSFVIPRFGGGIEYYLLKQLALGVETNIAVGPGIYPVAGTGVLCGAGNGTCIGFWGNWDFGLGARFAF